MNARAEAWLARYQDEGEIRERLLNGAKFIAIFESLKNFLSDSIRGFYTHDLNDIIITGKQVTYRERDDYKAEVKSLDHKFPFKSHVLWILENEAITIDDKDFLFEAYALRNELVHNFLEAVFDPQSKFDTAHLMKLATLEDHIGRWWILNFEVPLMENPPNEISIHDVQYGASMFTRKIMSIK